MRALSRMGLGMGLAGSVLGGLGGGGAGDRVPDDPDYYRLRYVIDATGQADGTGYTAEESRHAQAITYNGNAAIASGKFEFDGTGDCLSLPPSGLGVPGSKFTIEIFGLEFDAVDTGDFQFIFSRDNSSGTRGIYLREFEGELVLVIYHDAGTGTSISLGAVSAGVEYDIALCWDGSTLFVLKDGVQINATAFTGVPDSPDSTVPTLVGAGYTAGIYVNELDGRLTAIVFTAGECLYTAGSSHSIPSLPRSITTPTLTDSDWPDVVCLIGYDSALGRVRDFGPLDLSVRLIGNAAGGTGVTLADGTGTIAFDGSGDRAAIRAEELSRFGSGDFTIETYFRVASNNVRHDLINSFDNGDDRQFSYSYRGNESPDVMRWLGYETDTGAADASLPSASFTPAINTMYHAAVCRDSGTVRHFVAGTQNGADHSYSGALNDNWSNIILGALDGGSGFGNELNGYMAEIRITKAARYTADFTAPTGALPRG